MDNRDTGAYRDAGDTGTSPDTIAGATGGAGGAVAGAALGSIVGPVGTIIGALAGAVGGWWGGKHMAEPHVFNEADDAFYQTHHQTNYSAIDSESGSLGRGRSYNDVRPAYQLGHLAGVNPDYQHRSFDEIEPHLSSAYSTANPPDEQQAWPNVRRYAQDGWSRGRESGAQRLRASE